jgi:hypothetical protein
MLSLRDAASSQSAQSKIRAKFTLSLHELCCAVFAYAAAKQFHNAAHHFMLHCSFLSVA